MFKIIPKLKNAKPKHRQKILLDMQEKNVRYLRQKNADLAGFVQKQGTGRFGIRITDDFLEVFERQSGVCCHPPGRLLEYMQELGSWHHSGWVDKLSIQPVFRGNSEHGRLLTDLLNALHKEMPELKAKLAGGMVQLPVINNMYRYSGPVIFLGVFTGLHIISYLNRTQVSDIFLVEPDLDRFSLSCLFLDYGQMEKTHGTLLLHVGPNAPQYPIERLITQAPVTAATWVRLLPAYPSEEFDDIINRAGLRWRALTEIFVPYDRELQNLKHGMQNIRDKRPFPHTPPSLSEKSTIAVVASGPSLNQNMSWLKENQDRLIIMASISCVRVLRENGIRADFQCTLDTELDEPLFEQLQMDSSVPLVAYFKINPDLAKRFDKVLMVYEDGKANPVRFFKSITHTHPTTGNFMTAFAAWCKPVQLLFVGLDLGFRDAKRSHVEGGWHDENEGIGHVAETAHAEHLKVAANFPESEGQILTMSYYNNARLSIENVVAEMRDRARIYNLADGAKITGAEPMHAEDLELLPYPEKQQDLEAIVQGFSTNFTEIMEPYDISGRELLDDMTCIILETVGKQKLFDWPAFSRAINIAWGIAVQHSVTKHRDLRIEIYAKLIHDALAEWYRTLLLANSPAATRTIYAAGLKALGDMFAALHWPDELDAAPDNQSGA